MSTIEDKILDGPKINYCDAEDDDVRTGDDIDENHEGVERNDASSLFVRPDDVEERINQVKLRGGSNNTGPKGVIGDYKRQTNPNAQKQKQDNFDELDAEFQELLNDDSILKDYISKRINDSLNLNVPSFGHLHPLKTGPELLDAIDKENPDVLVIVHLYRKYSRPCANLDRCLSEIAEEFKHVKFVTLDAGVTGLSANFKENGVPALLAYKKGDLVKSLVQLEEFLDKDFDSSQVKELLIENGLLS